MRKYNDTIKKKCLLCGVSFTTSKKLPGSFCSISCSTRAQNWIRSGKLKREEIGVLCPVCRKALVHRSNRNPIFCSHNCAAKNNYIKRYKSNAICHPDRPLVSNGLCQSCWAKKYYRENKAAAKLYSRISRLQNSFGITIEQWDRLFTKQNGLCPICDKPLYKPDNEFGKKAAAVDHDHKTGRVRGLTCDHCNRFKIAKNDKNSAYKLVTYLSSDFDGRFI